jgi:HEAT repeat protein
VQLEGSRRLVVLARVENRAIQKFAAYSADCDLDAGGRPTVWLDGVKPADSVAYLATSANDVAAALPASGRSSRSVDSQLLALSLHADPAAIPALIQLAKAAPVAHVRAQSLFWLAQRAGAKVLSTITGAIENDPETEVKVRAVFALSQLPKDESVPLLIGLARANKNPQVRKQAMFWLGQSKDPRALAFFEDVLLK